MECEDVHADLADYLAGRLPAAAADAFERHLQDCRACAADVAGLEETWHGLGELAADPVPAAALRARVSAVIDGYGAGADRQAAWVARARQAGWLAAAAAVLFAAFAIGRQNAPAPATDVQVAALRDEMRALREMTAIALLHQPSPSDRLKGVTWTGQIDQPGSEVALVLLDTLMRDPNVNVRLAAIDALKRFGDREAVRRGTLEALKHQSSPLVQIALIDLAADINGPAAAEALRRLSDDPQINAAVRARAAAMLQRVG
jgi:HEAT repeat protein